MGYLEPLAPRGAGALALVDPIAPRRTVCTSQAYHLLNSGDRAAAVLALSPAVREALPVAVAYADQRMEPTDPETVMARVSAVLALTAATGMTPGARTEWLTAAADALKGIPRDLLDRGVTVARSRVDHPRQIVPAILAEVKDAWLARRGERAALRALSQLTAAPPDPSPPPARCTPDEARAIMAAHGIAPGADPTRPTRMSGGTGIPGRRPSRADYLRMGVDPAVLDQIEAEAAGAGVAA